MATAPPLLKSCFTFKIQGIDSKVHYSKFKLRCRAAAIRASSSTTAPADRSKMRRSQNVDGDFFVGTVSFLSSVDYFHISVRNCSESIITLIEIAVHRMSNN